MILLTIVHFWRIRKDGGLSRPVWKLKPQTAGDDWSPLARRPKPRRCKCSAGLQDKTYGLMEVVTGKPIFETITPEEEEDTVFSYPYAFFREAIALMVTVTGIMAVSLFFNAPLEELANPAKTPNPAKAPWYFLGLQELVSHSALLGGVVAPALMVLALLAIPYLDRNPSRRPADRKWILWLFTVFVVANLVLIVIGTFFRGPGLGVCSTLGTCCCGGRVMERRLPQIFFALSMLALALIVAAVWQASTPSWKTYQRKFFQLEAQGEPNAITKAAVLATPPQIHQVLLPGLQRVDRCTTCHLGVDDPTMKNAPEPFRYHAGPRSAHSFEVRLHHLPWRPGPGDGHERRARQRAVLAGPAAVQGLHSRLLRPLPQGRRCARRAGID